MAIYMTFPNGLKKVFTMSYDDGVRQDRRLIEILDRYGIKATFNINSGIFEADADYERKDGRMSAEEIKVLFENSPHEVAVHGLEHAYDHILHPNCMANEILEDRKNIEKLTGRIVRGMAYPFGTFNDRLVECLKACGIVYSRTVISSERFTMPSDWLRLEPTCHHRNKKIFELCDRFIDSNPRIPEMFYVWGHSYEFDRNTEFNSWEHIERVAEKMSGHKDIWYATNIEIYDYTRAYENLVISTDYSRIYNPNAIDVWVDKGDWSDGKVYCIKAGETLELK